ncbi:Glucan endo-1,3-beta-glucosidase [Linum perenne]
MPFLHPSSLSFCSAASLRFTHRRHLQFSARFLNRRKCFPSSSVAASTPSVDHRLSYLSRIPSLASNRTLAQRWIYVHVFSFFPRTKISIISVGVDAVPELRYLLSAIRNVHLALRDLGIKKISVSTTFSFINLVTTAFPPSSETLQSDGNFSNPKHSPISHLDSVSVKFRNEISDSGEEFEFEVVVEEETETESSVSSFFTGALFFSPV